MPVYYIKKLEGGTAGQAVHSLYLFCTTRVPLCKAPIESEYEYDVSFTFKTCRQGSFLNVLSETWKGDILIPERI